MVIEKIFVNNATQLSLSDRFTILQSVQPGLPPRRNHAHNSYDIPHTSNSGFNRLVGRIGLTPMARAAMELRRVPLKHRIGKLNDQNLYRNERRRSRSFSNLSHRRPRSLNRTNSYGNINRSSSSYDLSGGSSGDERSFRPQKPRWRGRYRYNNQNRNSQDAGSGNDGRGTGRGRGRGRGQGRGRGRGRGRGGWNRSNQPPPNRDDLDKELDLYMAGTKNQLDGYMIDAMDISY